MLYLSEEPDKAAMDIQKKYGKRAQEFMMFQIKYCQENGKAEEVDGWKRIAMHLRKIAPPGNK